MPEPLDFRTQQRARTTSWKRADPGQALIETVVWNRWRVMLPGSTTPHAVHLEREHGAYVGRCDCPGFDHHDGPCAHLCTVRKAAYGHFDDLRGRRIRIRSANEERAGHFAEPEESDDRLRADGGVEAAYVQVCPDCGEPEVAERKRNGQGRPPDSEHVARLHFFGNCIGLRLHQLHRLLGEPVAVRRVPEHDPAVGITLLDVWALLDRVDSPVQLGDLVTTSKEPLDPVGGQVERFCDDSAESDA